MDWNDFIRMLTSAFVCVGCLLPLFGELTQQNEAIPQFWQLPDPETFVDEMTTDVSIQVIVSPLNTTLSLGVMSMGSGGNAEEMKQLDFSTFAASLSSDSVRVKVESRKTIANNREQWILKLIRYQSIFEKSLHVLATNHIGTVTSKPFRIVKKFLNPFPLVHHESVEFLMGNVGQIVCMIPHSKPSPPHIEFLLDNIIINSTKGGRYKTVYLSSGSMILLIKNLVPQDAGSYTCTASLVNTTSFQKSDKMTRLAVLAPKKKMKPRYRLSSHETERSGTNRIIEVAEGSNITLYCLYESAPVAEVSWYWPNNNRKYEVDIQFGTILVPNVQREDASEFSCSADDVVGRTFKIKIIELPRITSTPMDISLDESIGQSLSLRCDVTSQQSLRTVKWLHNGRILTDDGRKNKFIDNMLYISSPSPEYLGIYQCLLESDGNLWATGLTVITKEPMTDKNIRSENSSIIDKRTSSGLTIHLQCSPTPEQRVSITGFTVKWFRGIDSREPIDLISNKYVTFNKKSEKKVILSIVNPTKPQDEGIYICRLYSVNGQLLRATMFRLTIDEQKSAEPNHFVTNPRNIFIKKNLVAAPEISKVAPYLMAAQLTWKLLLDNNASVKIYHYRIQYQRKPLLEKSARKDTNDDRKSNEWSEEKLLDEYTTTNHITIFDSHILLHATQIRFRVIVIPKISSSITSLSIKNQTIVDNFSSDWSKAVDFRNILNCKLSLSNNKARTATAVEVMWTHTCGKEPHWRRIVFHIVFISITDCIKTKRCLLDKGMKAYEPILMLPEYQDLLQTNPIERDFGEFFQTNITGLKSGHEYVIGMYGKVTSVSNDVTFISLSNIINVTTAAIKMADERINGDQLNQSVNDDVRNRVIFLVLGSLAGVLFVVAAVMFGMCTWYYMKKHMKKHKAKLISNDVLQPSLLFHYPPSSMSSPMCYSSRIDSSNPYQGSLVNNNHKFMYFTPQKIGNSPLTLPGTLRKELWPVNFLNHSQNTVLVKDKFPMDRDSDIDSMCNSDKLIQNNARRNVVMGIDQASSTYSRVGSERRLSMGHVNAMTGEYSANSQNMTLPRHFVIPFPFPEPPVETKTELGYHPEREAITDPQPETVKENGTSVQFLNKSRGLCNGSINSLAQMDYKNTSRSNFAADNVWMAEEYYDPFSSNSPGGNEKKPFKSILQTYT